MAWTLWVNNEGSSSEWPLRSAPQKGRVKGGDDSMKRREGPDGVLGTPRPVWRQNPNVFHRER